MMNNLQCAVAVLERHRAARRWTDEAVAADLLTQLGVDPAGDAKNAVLSIDPSLVTEEQVAAAELAVKEANLNHVNLRHALDVQKGRTDKPALDAAAEAQQAQVAGARTAEAEREATQRLGVSADEHKAIDEAETTRREAQAAELDRVNEARRVATLQRESAGAPIGLPSTGSWNTGALDTSGAVGTEGTLGLRQAALGQHTDAQRAEIARQAAQPGTRIETEAQRLNTVLAQGNGTDLERAQTAREVAGLHGDEQLNPASTGLDIAAAATTRLDAERAGTVAQQVQRGGVPGAAERLAEAQGTSEAQRTEAQRLANEGRDAGIA